MNGSKIHPINPRGLRRFGVALRRAVGFAVGFFLGAGFFFAAALAGVRLSATNGGRLVPFPVMYYSIVCFFGFFAIIAWVFTNVEDDESRAGGF